MMKTWVVLLLAVAHTAAARGPARTVVYSSECSCENDHGVARWRAKTDRSEPPGNRNSIQAIVPSDMFGWPGPGTIPRGGARLGKETQWFALTGRVITLQAENDADVHMVLVDATGNKPGKVIAELPLGDRWCRLRTIAFGWTNVVFPFEVTRDEYPFELIKHPIVTVIGKAFYDVDHSGKDYRINRRPRAKDKAVWEIHPIMQMEVLATPATALKPVIAAPVAVPSTLLSQPNAADKPALELPQFVTLTQPVTVKIAYDGEAVLPRGMKLPLVSRDGVNAIVRYIDGTQAVPLSSTDLK